MGLYDLNLLVEIIGLAQGVTYVVMLLISGEYIVIGT